jgi:hypothetical protein
MSSGPGGLAFLLNMANKSSDHVAKLNFNKHDKITALNNRKVFISDFELADFA